MKKAKKKKLSFPSKGKPGSSTTSAMRGKPSKGKDSSGSDSVAGRLSDAVAASSGRGTISSGKKMDLKKTGSKSGSASVNRFNNY